MKSFIVAAILLFTGCDLELNNFNDPRSNSFFKMQYLFCLSGIDSSLCPRIPIKGNIFSNSSNTPIGGAVLSFSKGDGSTPITASSDTSGNFSNFAGSVNFNVTVKSFNKVMLGSFGVSIENDYLVKISNVSSGLSVNATKDLSGVSFTIGVEETSFFSFLGSATGTDTPSRILQTSDNGYLIVGTSDINISSIGSITPIISNTTGTNDCLVVKLNSSGAVSWYSFYGGAGNDNCFAADETIDGNFVITGTAATGFSSLGGVSTLNSFSGTSTFDGLVLKISSTGKVQWYTFLGSGGTGATMPASILQTNDNSGYILGGSSHAALTTFSGVTPKNSHSGGASVFDQFILKLDDRGSFTWITYIGGSTSSDSLLNLSITADGGYIGIGNASALTSSISGLTPKLSFSGGLTDQFITKIDSNGNLQWFTYLGSGAADDGSGVYGTSDGGAVVTGKFGASATINGKSPLLTFSGATSDCFSAKLNSSGDLEWFTFIGSSSVQSSCTAATETSDSNIVLYGYTTGSISTLGGTSPQYPFAGGTSDLMLIKLSASGSVKWYEMIGSSSGAEQSKFITPTSDGGFIFSGSATGSIASIGSKTPIISYSGLTDWLLVKVKADGKL